MLTVGRHESGTVGCNYWQFTIQYGNSVERLKVLIRLHLFNHLRDVRSTLESPSLLRVGASTGYQVCQVFYTCTADSY